MEGGEILRLNGIIMQKKEENLKEKKWILKTENSEADDKAVQEIAVVLGINPIIAKLLYSRGYKTPKEAKKFIYMESEMLCNPFDMKDMLAAVERVEKSIKSGEKITIYGDYDVDGVTAVCTLYLYLKSKGANIDYYIPNRACEGYGVSKTAIDSIALSGTKLIITVDTGITANEEIEYAKKLGVDFVITDHHECRADIPSADAVVNPHRPDCTYPFKELAGVGVVFKFVSAFEEKTENISRIDATSRIFAAYADLVAIGTIADVMPIKEENRLIVSFGLKMLESSERPGISALIKASSSNKNDRAKKKYKITSGFIGYTLAPRINAAGRIKSAERAVELFLSSDFDEAYLIAEELCDANKERQQEENKIIEEAYEKIAAIDIEKHPVLVLDADDWHHGVIGIVSSRITEKYSRPSILISFKQNEGDIDLSAEIGKGSGRSIKGLNLVDALCYCSEHLVKFGGHELAAGLSVERNKLKLFRDKINEYAALNLTKEDMIPTVEADCEIKFSDVNLRFAENLQILEPYGVGNPMPVFVMRDVFVQEILPISEGKHTRFIFSDGNSSLSAMYFSNSPSSLGIYNGDRVDVLFNVDVNDWMGRRSAQIIVKDVKPSAESIKRNTKDIERYEQIHAGSEFSAEENIIPDRDDFALLYKFLVNSVRSGNDNFSIRELLSELSHFRANDFNYVKLKVMIKVFAELNIIGIEETDEDRYIFSPKYTSSKTDLDKSNILRKLRQQKKKVMS